MKTIILFSLLMSLSDQKIKWGSCPTVVTATSFDKTTYVGDWYTTRRSKGVPWENKDCPLSQYSLRTDGKIAALNSQYSISDDKITETSGILEFTNGAKGKMTRSRWISGNYHVLETDYTGYSIVYSCTRFLFLRFEHAWFLTRSKAPTTATLDSYYDTLNGKVDTFSDDGFEDPDHSATDCKYLNDPA